ERNETEAEPAKLYDFGDDRVARTLAGRLPIGPPYGAERAMLRAASHGLDRGPHVSTGRHQVPSRGKKAIRRDTAALPLGQRRAADTIGEHHRPDCVAIPFYNGMRASKLARLFRIQGGMDSPEYDPRAACSGEASNFQATQCIRGVDTDADYVAGLNIAGL